MKEKEMKERKHTPLCGQAEALVAYLYGEASADETKNFEQHMRDCASCRDELTAFGHVREAVGAWRVEALKGAPSLAFDSAAAQLTTQTPAPKRSALAALREFFTLSPLWLSASSVAAIIVLCALAILAIAHAEIHWDNGSIAFRTGLRAPRQQETSPVPAGPAQPVYTPEQVSELVAQRDAIQRELEAARTQIKEQARTIEANEERAQQVAVRSDVTPITRPSRRNTRRRDDVVPFPSGREQPLIAGREEDIPSLYGLLNEAY